MTKISVSNFTLLVQLDVPPTVLLSRHGQEGSDTLFHEFKNFLSQRTLFRPHQFTCGLSLKETSSQYTVDNESFENNHLRVGWVSSQLGFRGLGEADISPNCHVVNGIVDAHILKQYDKKPFRYFLIRHSLHFFLSSKAKYVP